MRPSKENSCQNSPESYSCRQLIATAQGPLAISSGDWQVGEKRLDRGKFGVRRPGAAFPTVRRLNVLGQSAAWPAHCKELILLFGAGFSALFVLAIDRPANYHDTTANCSMLGAQCNGYLQA